MNKSKNNTKGNLAGFNAQRSLQHKMHVSVEIVEVPERTENFGGTQVVIPAKRYAMRPGSTYNAGRNRDKHSQRLLFGRRFA